MVYIPGILTEESSWFVRGDKKKGIQGAQIDFYEVHDLPPLKI